jgi:AcrR family transcriptional regulator
VRTTTPSSSRSAILDSALALAGGGATTVTLESVAQASGLTKPGVMYHFRNKQALMAAAVDHVIDRYERELLALVPDGTSASVEQRLLGYAEWALTAEIDRSDLVMFSDPRLVDVLTRKWSERLRPWLQVPEGTPAATRVRLHAVRMAADGSWFADASGILPLSTDERRDLLAFVRDLLEESS